MSPTQWIYVTGCDSGFGSIVVKDLAARDFGVFATHLMDESAAVLKAAHSNIVPLKVDITKQDSVDAAAIKIKAKLAEIPKAQLYGLINNAGLLFQTGPVEWTPAKNYEIMFAVNVVGAARVTNSVLPLLRKHGAGRIVNVASIAGRIGIPTQAAYCASKHAMEAYSDCCRRELRDWGITVSIIEPGIFNKTGLYATYGDGVQKLWEGISAEVKADYGESYRDAVQTLGNKGLNQYGSADSSKVPKTMVEAMTCSRPKYRYQVGGDAKFLIPWFKWFHEAWQDVIFNVEKAPTAAAMDPKAGKRTLARYDNGSWFKTILKLLVMWYMSRALRRW